ncbi:MAG: hypothetical protein HY830_27890, partial [Actinobacteria bacterium]|nr:hypothetical protein [Actinomycetota bacterium]
MHPRLWSISRKLLALSLLGVLVAVAIGGTAWVSARQLRSHAEEVARLTQADQALRDLDMYTSDVQVAQRDALLAVAPADQGKATADLEATAAEIEAATTALDAVPLPGDLRGLVQGQIAAYAQWLQGTRATLPALGQVQPGTKEAIAAAAAEAAKSTAMESRVTQSRETLKTA